MSNVRLIRNDASLHKIGSQEKENSQPSLTSLSSISRMGDLQSFFVIYEDFNMYLLFLSGEIT